MANLSATDTGQAEPELSNKCFICDQVIKFYSSYDNAEKKFELCQRFCTLVCRFLNFTTPATANYVKPRKTLSSSNNNKNDTTVTLVMEQQLCDRCFLKADTFCDLYGKWTKLKLELNEGVKEISGLMKNSGQIWRYDQAKEGNNNNHKMKMQFRKKFVRTVKRTITNQRDYPQLKLTRLPILRGNDDGSMYQFVPILVKMAKMKKSPVALSESTGNKNGDTGNNITSTSTLPSHSIPSEDSSKKNEKSDEQLESDVEPNFDDSNDFDNESLPSIADAENESPAADNIQTGIGTDETVTTEVDQSEEFPFKCGFCPSQFSTWRSCQTHTYRKHKYKKKKGTQTSCKFCGKIFPFASALAPHLRKHTGERPYKCQLCDSKFKQSGHIEMHLTSFHKLGKDEARKLWAVWRSEEKSRKVHLKSSTKPDNENENKNEKKILSADDVCENILKIDTEVDQIEEFPFKCRECPRQFSTWRSCQTHTTRKHKYKKKAGTQFPCKFCGKIFTYVSALETHVRSHTGERPYKCQLCDSKFKQSSHVEVHLISTHDLSKEEARKLRAVWKSEEESRKVNLKSSTKPDNENKNEKKILSTDDVHENVPDTEVDQNEEFPFKCRVCPRQFSTWRSCQTHTTRKHKYKKKAGTQSSCKFCGKIFTYVSALKTHMRKHAEEQVEYENGEKITLTDSKIKSSYGIRKRKVKPNYQEDGGDEFVSAAEDENEKGPEVADKKIIIENGKQNEEESLDFNCSSCDKRFSTLRNCRIHQAHAHAQKAKRKYRKKFKHVLPNNKKKTMPLPKSINSNITNGTNDHEHAPVKKAKPFSCWLCGKGFQYKFNLTIHERIHTGELPYQCSLCETSLAQMSHLQTHLTAWHGLSKEEARKFTWKKKTKKNKIFVKKAKIGAEQSEALNFKCTLCDREFSNWRNCKIHRARVHKIFSHKTKIENLTQDDDTNNTTTAMPIQTQEISNGTSNNTTMTTSTTTSFPSANNVNGKPFPCSECGESFSFRIALKIHERKHLKNANLQKEILPAGVGADLETTNSQPQNSSSNSNSNAEEEKQADEKVPMITTDKPKYDCEMCGRRWTAQSGLRNHLSLSHGILDVEVERLVEKETMRISGERKKEINIPNATKIEQDQDKPFTCHFCDKTFTYKYNLMVHERVHKNEYPYGCEVCDAKFTTFIQLQRHLSNFHALSDAKVKNLMAKDLERRQSEKINKVNSEQTVSNFFEGGSVAAVVSNGNATIGHNHIIKMPALNHHDYYDEGEDGEP